MKNLIKNLSNTQKKILAGVLTITSPVWIIIAFPLFVLFGMSALLYAIILDELGVEENE
jgi:hypothetical protein